MFRPTSGASNREGATVRARDLGIRIGHAEPGPYNAITDVDGVRVGHCTLVEGEGRLVVGRGPVRTGVTIVVPHQRVGQALLFAGCHRLNGNGELTGLEWVRESGLLTTPIGLTNTHSVGVVRDALIAAQARTTTPGEVWWSLPVVGETWDGTLNDVNGQHVRPEHVEAALSDASGGPVLEGNVGGGTGMVCHGFKGGIGTASRVVPGAAGGFTVGVLVQANYGRRERLAVNGVPVGLDVPPSEVPLPSERRFPWGDWPDAGSIIVVVATDAPLLPHQCDRLAQRSGLGVARMGGAGEHSSGDLFLAFSTANADAGPHPAAGEPTALVHMLSDEFITPLYYATVEATEEAILNALLAADTMTGRDGNTAHRLPADRLVEVMAAYGRGRR
jgi:D-aminopeptidase